MTTLVRVVVPEGARWDVAVTYEDFQHPGTEKARILRSTTEFLYPGASCDFHITDSRSITQIVELRHEPVVITAEGRA